VACWHLGEGDRFGFGTDLCDLLITEVESFDKAHSDRLVPVDVRYHVRIRASEPGTLRSILATAGSDVVVGDPLAMVSTDPGEVTDELPSVGAPALRVVADMIRPGEDD
jgi:hypothetical protein